MNAAQPEMEHHPEHWAEHGREHGQLFTRTPQLEARTRGGTRPTYHRCCRESPDAAPCVLVVAT